MPSSPDTNRELGRQPLDELLTRFNLANADLVGASSEQLSFKVIQKGRTGRRLTPHAQKKILRALAALRPDHAWTLRDLFNY